MTLSDLECHFSCLTIAELLVYAPMHRDLATGTGQTDRQTDGRMQHCSMCGRGHKADKLNFQKLYPEYTFLYVKKLQ